jgi:RNA polymerase sigma factor (sigma-70 family)
MHELDDHTLLRQYAEQNSETAFAALVARHVDKVYSTALRHTRNVHAAEEITQAVFVILAKKSGRLGAKVILSGWLYETARLTALTFIRSEIRRARREQEAHMTTALNENESEVWPHIAPLLDDALAKLSAADRHAVVLRYFDGKSLGEVGAALGASEDAAKKRVTRAVEKLRGWFTKRGVTLTATVFTAAISANSVQAAPLGLAATVTATAVKGVAVSGSTLTLIKGALKIMAWTKAKTAIVVTAGVLLAAGTAIIAITQRAASDDPWANLDIGSLQRKTYQIRQQFNEQVKREGWPLPKSVREQNLKDVKDANDEFFKKFPSGVIIRQSHFDQGEGARTNFGYVFNGQNQIIARAVSFQKLLAFSHKDTGQEFPATRLVLTAALPAGKFDVLVNVRDHGREELQAQIKQQFGLVGHTETLKTNVLVLKMKNPAAPGLKTEADSKPGVTPATPGRTYISTTTLAQTLEADFFHRPVVDETELTDPYAHTFVLPETARNLDLLRENLLNQFGLELIPDHRPVEMLVVEKVK